jgi:hypothetical protein
MRRGRSDSRFGAYAHTAGSSRTRLQARLGDMHPELVPMMPNLFIAVSDEMQSSAWVLIDGEVVDLIAPMAGG